MSDSPSWQQSSAQPYWQRVLETDLAVPADRPIADLTADLVSMLGSTDPSVREPVGFGVLTTWVSSGIYDDLLASLGDSVSNGLAVGLGGTADASVFRRVLSARVLTSCVARDNEARVLQVDVAIGWAERAIGWFTRERDLRSHARGQGAVRTVRHGATLLGELAASRHLTADHLGVLLDVVAERVAATTEPLHPGDDDALALVALTVAHRDLVAVEVLERWVEHLAAIATATDEIPATDPAATDPAATDPAATDPEDVRGHNARLVLRTLFVLLSTGAVPCHPGAPLATQAKIRPDLLVALASALRPGGAIPPRGVRP